jgi:L-fuculose-phosphate aldolase
MLTAIGDVMRKCYEKGWITTRDGNVSLRKKGSNFLYITPSGVRKNKIEVENIVKIKIENNKLVIPDGKTPSGELHMHWLLQSVNNTQTRAVLHVHATNIVAAMYAGWSLMEIAMFFPEVNRYTKVGPNVPALPATSKELGDATFQAMTQFNPTDSSISITYDIVGQAYHGVCAIARHPWEAYEHVERLDHICEIVLKSGVKP